MSRSRKGFGGGVAGAAHPSPTVSSCPLGRGWERTGTSLPREHHPCPCQATACSWAPITGAVQALGLQASWTQFFGKDARSLRKGEKQADGAESPTLSDVPIQFTQPGTMAAQASLSTPWAPLPTPAPPHPCTVMPTPSVSVLTHCPSTPAAGLAAASPQRRRTPCLYRLQGMDRLRLFSPRAHLDPIHPSPICPQLCPIRGESLLPRYTC